MLRRTLIAFYLVAIVALTGCTHPQAAGTASPAAGARASATSATGAGASGGDVTTAVQSVVEQVRPAVVQITNEQTNRNPFGLGSVDVPAGVGSGVIYDGQGHILTN